MTSELHAGASEDLINAAIGTVSVALTWKLSITPGQETWPAGVTTYQWPVLAPVRIYDVGVTLEA